MSTAVPADETPVRYFAEFWSGVQVTRRSEGARRENWVKITIPRQGPDTVARFTAPYEPYDPAIRRIGHDDLLHANGWWAVGPWEYVAGLNAYRAPVEPLHPLITAGKAAVRLAEDHGSPETVAALDKALCALPVTPMDGTADRALHDALQAVARAEDAEEWELLADVERAVSQLIHEPDNLTMEHPAVRAVAMLATRCAFKEDLVGEGAAWAWHRGYLLGLEALGAVTGTVRGYTTGKTLDKAVTAFLASVRRAIPYAALYATRNALTEAARSYGLFVVGMRQPMPPRARWDWSRVIGNSVFKFEVTQPGQPHPYGSVAVRRVVGGVDYEPIRYFPLGPDEDNARAEVLYRI